MKFPLFLLSCLMAFLAGHMVNYSIIFLSLEWFDSHSIAGIGYALCFAPPVILGWFAGVYCDRYSPRNVILVAQNSYFVSLFLLYLAFDQSTDTQLILLLSAAFFSGIGWSFVAPARFAAVVFYVKPEKLMLGSIGLNLMVMTGFGLAPMLLKLVNVDFGWQGVMFTTVGLLFVSSLLLLPLKIKFKSKPADKTLAEIVESLKFIKGSPEVKQLLSLAAIAYLLMGPMQVLLPTVAEQTLQLSQTGQGNYLSLVAFSLIIGGLLTMAIKKKVHFGWLCIISIALAGAGIASLGVIEQLSTSVTLLIIASVCGGIAISLIVAGLQYFSPTQYRGRIMSVYTIIGQFIPAMSGLGAGIFAGLFSYQTALLLFGGLIIFSLLLASWRFKTIRAISQLESH
ncbi:MFS transporter [Psychrosphaera aquimarina]|uniref:MFS transporter n=1 Tax=Psychrosphaera aquimarina TaxID=2044854 RepID=A0ABU3R5B7_9GAMM|nr:MFS transporter [Psychrosphaera aquimarina]MDU0114665.1 MFS transporter [Psychrosphaera aquimarina]